MHNSRHIVLLFILILQSPYLLKAQAERNMLAANYTQDFLASHLTMAGIKESFPAYGERKKWDAINKNYSKAMITDGEAELSYTWQTVPATAYMEFLKTGDRYIMENIYNRNMTAIKKLAFAELAEGKGRFIPQLINGVWAVCEISSWSLSASLNLQKKGAGLPDVEEPIIELGAGITANMLAWTYYLFKEPFNNYNPLVSQRIKYEIDRRILQPYYQRNDFWWMDLDGQKRFVNNWNVWLNYNALTCILLVEEDANKRSAGIYKSMRSVDRFINYYKEDGGCEEGPAYWSHAGGMLFNYLSLLQNATGGSIDLFDKPLIKNIGFYICKAYIDSTYYLNYADAAAKLSPDAGIVYGFGKATKDSVLTTFGAYLARQQHWEKMVPAETMYAGIQNIFAAAEVLNTTPAQPFLAAAWMPGTGIAIARDNAGTSKGFYFSALAGHNGESHNHNDVGTCVLFYDGQPLLIDVGSETYTRQTFGPERYTIWTMRSIYHNLPLINGTEQKDGQEFTSRNTSFSNHKDMAVFSTDIDAAYPADASVKKWQRTYQLKRHQSFTITDNYELSSNNGKTELHFMTSSAIEKVKDGILQFITGNNRMKLLYDPAVMEPTLEPIPIKDNRLLQSWPAVITRLVFKCKDRKLKGSYKIVISPA